MKPRCRTPGALPVVFTAALTFLAVRPAAAEAVNILWTGSPSVGGTTIDLQVGDTIEWDIQLGHDLSEIPNQALFDACDFTGSTLISIGPAIAQTTFASPGVHYFACSVGLGFHCELLNMNVTVVVSEAEQLPTLSTVGLLLLGALLLVASIAVIRRRA
jgi:plastocyanin